VRSLTTKFVALKIDTDKNKKGIELATKHGVEGLPTILFMTPDRKVVHTVLGFKPVPEFLVDMQKALALKAKKVSSR
jgi:hypothetical protein